MVELAKSLTLSEFAQKSYPLYEKFLPKIPPGKRGWGASGKLDLEIIRKMVNLKEAQSEAPRPKGRGFPAR
jgi:hypothetical protein